MDLLPPQDNWTATGASGRVYLFRVHRRDQALPPGPALFVLGYHHPKGHLAGNTVDPAYLGLAENMAKEVDRLLADQARAACLKYEIVNCFCVLEGVDPLEYPRCLRDLAEALSLPCGHDPL